MSATRRSVRETLRADFAASPSWWSRATLVVFRLGEWADEHAPWWGTASSWARTP